MFEVRISKKAQKQIKLIKKTQRINTLQILEELAEDPFLGKPLSRELTGRFSYKTGVYRIIYKVNHRDKIVEILSAGHRATVYKKN